MVRTGAIWTSASFYKGLPSGAFAHIKVLGWEVFGPYDTMNVRDVAVRQGTTSQNDASGSPTTVAKQPLVEEAVEARWMAVQAHQNFIVGNGNTFNLISSEPGPEKQVLSAPNRRTAVKWSYSAKDRNFQ